MMSFCFRTATLAIASMVFTAGAQQPNKFRVSDDTAGGSASWFNLATFDGGNLEVSQGTDPVTNNPAAFVEFEVSKPNFFVDLECYAPGSTLSSKAFSSVSFQLADISTCDGGTILFADAEDCTTGTCVDIPLPHWSVSATWTKRGVRTRQQSGTTKFVEQDPFSGKILFSSQMSGIVTFYDASFVVDVNEDINSGLGGINFSKGVTKIFTAN